MPEIFLQVKGLDEIGKLEACMNAGFQKLEAIFVANSQQEDLIAKQLMENISKSAESHAEIVNALLYAIFASDCEEAAMKVLFVDIFIFSIINY